MLQHRIARLEQANAALLSDLERGRAILRSATDHAIFTLDLAGLVTSWNAGAERVLGYSGAEILGRSGEVFLLPEERSDGAFTAELCLALEHGRAANERWHARRDGQRVWASGTILPLMDAEGTPQGFLSILRDGSEAHAIAERREMLLGEMRHRVKNTLATVQSVATQTGRHSATDVAFQEAFTARLAALSRSHDLLGAGSWEGTPLAEVVEQSLAPYDGTPGRTRLVGPPVRLAMRDVVAVGLAFHELATNAAKYGALSDADGRVEVSWRLSRGGRDRAPSAEITWRERDGPPVRPPARRGFGSRLLERGLALASGATARIDFAREGVECRIRLPLETADRG